MEVNNGGVREAPKLGNHWGRRPLNRSPPNPTVGAVFPARVGNSGTYPGISRSDSDALGSSLDMVRNFEPEILARNIRGSRTLVRKFSPEISGDRKFRPLTPEVPASHGCNGQILGEAINSLLLPQEVAAPFFSSLLHCLTSKKLGFFSIPTMILAHL